MAVQANGPFVSLATFPAAQQGAYAPLSAAHRWLLSLQVSLSSGSFRRISGKKMRENSGADGLALIQNKREEVSCSVLNTLWELRQTWASLERTVSLLLRLNFWLSETWG